MEHQNLTIDIDNGDIRATYYFLKNYIRTCPIGDIIKRLMSEDIILHNMILRNLNKPYSDMIDIQFAAKAREIYYTEQSGYTRLNRLTENDHVQLYTGGFLPHIKSNACSEVFYIILYIKNDSSYLLLFDGVDALYRRSFMNTCINTYFPFIEYLQEQIVDGYISDIKSLTESINNGPLTVHIYNTFSLKLSGSNYIERLLRESVSKSEYNFRSLYRCNKELVDLSIGIFKLPNQSFLPSTPLFDGLVEFGNGQPKSIKTISYGPYVNFDISVCSKNGRSFGGIEAVLPNVPLSVHINCSRMRTDCIDFFEEMGKYIQFSEMLSTIYDSMNSKNIYIFLRHSSQPISIVFDNNLDSQIRVLAATSGSRNLVLSLKIPPKNNVHKELINILLSKGDRKDDSLADQMIEYLLSTNEEYRSFNLQYFHYAYPGRVDLNMLRYTNNYRLTNMAASLGSTSRRHALNTISCVNPKARTWFDFFVSVCKSTNIRLDERLNSVIKH